MANTITGIILIIGQTVAVPTNNQNGQPFYKRELILDASRYDQFSGRKFENYPKFEFVGNNCTMLDQFQVGQAVTVSFVLSGRKVEKDGQVNYFTNITGYKVELYQRQQPVQQPQQAVPYQGQTQPAYQGQAQPAYQPQQPSNPFPATAPTGAPAAQPFPPAVDEDGNPLGTGEDGDLPF